MVWGAYYVQTGEHNWNTLWISLPVAFLVSSILHANDIRDIQHDKDAGIKTLALMIDSDFNYTLYKGMIVAAYASIAVLVALGFVGLEILPLACLLALLTLPLGIKQIKQAEAARLGDMQQRGTLEPASAQFHFKFGLAYFVSLLVAIALQYFL